MSAARWSMDWEPGPDPLEYGLYDNWTWWSRPGWFAAEAEAHQEEEERERRRRWLLVDTEPDWRAVAVGFTAFRPDVLLVWRRLLGLEG